MDTSNYPKLSCKECLNGEGLPFSFTMAFQPIVDAEKQEIYSYEALVRGVNGEGAFYILKQVTPDLLYRFDQACRVKAIQLAAKLKISTYLNINFLPNAIYKPETCIRTTFEACQEYNFPSEKIIFEVTEQEKVFERGHLVNIFQEYRKMEFQTAIDDFGEGYSGLALLAEFQPDFIKIDRSLIQEIQNYKAKQIILKGILEIAKDLNIKVEAEGVETKEEYLFLKQMGVHFFQGYYFGKPIFENVSTTLNIQWN